MHCSAYLVFLESFGSVDPQAFRNIIQIESSFTNHMSPLFASNQKICCGTRDMDFRNHCNLEV